MENGVGKLSWKWHWQMALEKSIGKRLLENGIGKWLWKMALENSIGKQRRKTASKQRQNGIKKSQSGVRKQSRKTALQMAL
jgi:hypothetical protein